MQKPQHDPRQPENAARFKVGGNELKEQELDTMALMSLVFGAVGLLMRHTLSAWISLFCAISSVANLKIQEMDLKQIFSTVTFAVMSLLINYFGPNAAVYKT